MSIIKSIVMILMIMRGGIDMPNIKPISDLRNYTAVINEVRYGNRVYLTRNGHGQCAIIDMKELDELDKQKALYQLMNKLNEAEVSIREEGTVSAEALEAELEKSILRPISSPIFSGSGGRRLRQGSGLWKSWAGWRMTEGQAGRRAR